MKKIILLSATFFSITVYAQTTIRLGVEAGPNMTLSYAGTNASETKSSPAYAFWGGALLEASLKQPDDIFKLQFGILYNQQHQKFSSAGTDYSMRFQQISMPLTGKIYFSPRASFNFGPVFNFAVGAKEKTTSPNSHFESTIEKGYLTTVQGGATFGLSYYCRNGLFITGSYNQMSGYALQNDNQSGVPFRPRLNYARIGIGFLFHSFSPDVPGSGS